MQNLTAYLIGPIESAVDHGVGWRTGLKPKLEQINIKSINPIDYWNDKELDIEQGHNIIHWHRLLKDWPNFLRWMDDIWSKNEPWVYKSDFLIAHFSEGDVLGGTIREMQIAFDLCKPMFLVYTGDINKVNCHVLHLVLKWGRIFTNFDELIEFLKNNSYKLAWYCDLCGKSGEIQSGLGDAVQIELNLSHNRKSPNCVNSLADKAGNLQTRILL